MKRITCGLVLAFLASCGGGTTPPPPTPPPKTPEPAKVDEKKPEAAPKAEPGEAGSVAGTVKAAAGVKSSKPIKPAEEKCAAKHPDGRITNDEIVVDGEQNLRWAFVYVKSDVGKKYPAPEKPVLLDQVGCRYEPHVLGLVAGQKLLMKNSDDLLHNVHGLPFNNKEWNIGQTPGAQDERALDRNEVMVKVKCEVHPWMLAWVGVLDHPFFAVTDAAGKFEIKGLPPGKHTLAVWHERLKADPQEITVKAKEAATAGFTLSPKE